MTIGVLEVGGERECVLELLQRVIGLPRTIQRAPKQHQRGHHEWRVRLSQLNRTVKGSDKLRHVVDAGRIHACNRCQRVHLLLEGHLGTFACGLVGHLGP